MAQSGYGETRATARLPSLDIEIVHRRPPEGGDEQISMTVRAVPSLAMLHHLWSATEVTLLAGKEPRISENIDYGTFTLAVADCGQVGALRIRSLLCSAERS